MASTAPHLLALQPVVQPAELTLDDDGCTIGRAATCALVVAGSVVSRRHAQIERAGARFELRDLGSVNGTYVNGQRIHQPHLLSNHDLIGLGEAGAQLTFVDPDVTRASTARLRYDDRTMRFFLGQTRVELTPNQFRLLLHLHRCRGQLCTREQCAVAVWGPDYGPGMDATSLDRLVSAVRATLRHVDPEARLIETRPGLGYQLADGA